MNSLRSKSSQKTLILGMAAGYSYEDVEPFLTSLERSGFAGKCVLFVSASTCDCQKMAGHGCGIVYFERPALREHLSYNAYRYFLYLDYLQHGGLDFSHVLLTDVRDVIFQSDPFDCMWGDGLNVALEDGGMTIGTCPHNSLWVREHLGEKALEMIQHENILCSGTTVGTQTAIIGYLKALTEKLLPFAGGDKMDGYDQGIHNFLLRNETFGSLFTHNNEGPIMTLGHKKENPCLDAEGFVLNDKGTRAVIIHQYDRNPELFRHIRHIYTTDKNSQ